MGEGEAQKKWEVKTQGRTCPCTALGGPLGGQRPRPSLASQRAALGRSRNDTNTTSWDTFGGPLNKSLPANAGDTGSTSSLGRSHMPRGN